MKPTITKHLLWLTLICIALFDASTAKAQSTSVELLGTVTANQASTGLGFVLDPGQEWEFAAAAAAGATHARFQCSWSTVEQQSAPPNNVPGSPQYVEDPACATGFALAKKYGIHPTVVAAYGAPYHNILTVVAPNGVPVGATSIDLELVSGVGGDTLANIKFPYSYICPAAVMAAGLPPACVGPTSTVPLFTNRSQYEGALITSVTVKDATHATITLASRVRVAEPAGVQYNVNEILYPATLTELGTDPSVVAYGNYVSFLAKDIAAHGLTGTVEIWNEPPNSTDPWDNRCLLYDADLGPPCPSTTGSAPGPYDPNYGFVADIQNRTFPAGITATWNGTSGSGSSSILGPRMFSRTGVYAKQPATTVAFESFHVYGLEPEEILWRTDCLEAAAAAYPNKATDSMVPCLLPGEPTFPNNVGAVYLDKIAKLTNPAFGVAHSVTETGMLPFVPGYQDAQARFVVRQFLGLQAVGLTPVHFFQLWNGVPDPTFAFVQHFGNDTAYSPYPQYSAISGLMADLEPISSAPVTSYAASTLPSVSSFSGTFPLSTTHMVGARKGAAANSDAFFVWQRSFVPCDSNNVCGVWAYQASPAAAPVTINIPSSLKVTQVVDLTFRTNVAYTTSGSTISFNVADDPIEVLVDPASLNETPVAVALPTTTVVTSNVPTSNYTAPVTLTAVVSPYSTKTATTNGETVTFFSGTTKLGAAALASGQASITVSTLAAGTDTIIAEYAGDKNFEASAGFGSVTVSNSVANLTLPAMPDQTYGVAPIPVAAKSKSPGAILLTVVSGPARLATTSSTGVGTVAISGIGTITIGASQAASGGYSASPMVTTSFNVAPKDSGLAFNPIPTVTYGIAPFVVQAKSASGAAATYQAVSGPATISGNLVTITGSGTVVLEADVAASGNYAADSTTISFTVNPATTTLKIQPVAAQVYGATPFALSATSVAPGAITYAVVSGPATVSGNMVTITGAGTVVLKATQAASSNYKAATAPQITFTVGLARPTLALTSFATPTYGEAPFAIGATSNSPGAITYRVTAGPAKVSGNTVTITGASTVYLQAVQAATSNYLGASTQVGFAVTLATPQLTFVPVPNAVVGAKAFRVTATSPSGGAITYSVISGPATVSGNLVTVTAKGTVVLGAKQAAYGNYAASQLVQTSFTVSDGSAASAGLTLPVVANQAYTAAPFAVTAQSKSPGAITLSVVSGPATITSHTSTGGTVKITGVGPVVLGASQAASGNYAAVPVVQTSFAVLPADSELTFSPVSAKKVGMPAFLVLAKSHARALTSYRVVSGPATVSNNMVAITGPGTVLLEATQPAFGVYSAGLVQASFTIAAH